MENTVYIRHVALGCYDLFCSPEAAAKIGALPCANTISGPYGKSEYYIFLDLRYSHDDFMAAIRDIFEVKMDKD